MVQRYGYIAGVKEAREALQELDRRVQTAVGKRILRAPANVLIRFVKAKAKVSSDPSDKTPGSLRDSVKIGRTSSRKGQARLEIIADDIASVPNEFGTSKMQAQPFFRPGVDAGRNLAAEVAANAIRPEVDAAIARAAKRAKRR
jgi:HK97 gp10 family phage protein